MSFTALATTDFVVSLDAVTAPAWSSNLPTLGTFYTASVAQSSAITQDAFYLNVYQTASTANGAAVQFSIAYGNLNGSGSKFYNNLVVGVSPSLTTYKQYRTLVYGTALTASNQGFNFGGQAQNASDIFVINVDRNRYKESLFPGTFNLKLSGSGGEVWLTDNSNDLANSSSPVTYLDCGRAFTIVSGTNGTAIAAAATPPGATANGQTVQGSYGMFLPDIGTIILNPLALELTAGLGGIGLSIDRSSNPNLPTSSINNERLFTAMSQSGYFQLNSYESVSSNYVFVRIRNTDYNYTTNPTIITGSGDLIYSTLVNNPQTYITTVGMYNTANELLAVAKMSRPLLKDFTKEALLRVKLDW